MNKRCMFLALAILLLACPGFGQQTLATISGTVTDSAGAVVPGVAVTVRNVNTGIEKRLNTNEAGIYEVPYLIPGVYSVAAEKPGFKRYVASDFRVQAGQIVRIDAKLEVGELTTQVTVTEAAPAITTDSSQITSLRDNKQLEETPLNLRGSWDSFLFTYVGLMPGAQPGADSYDISFNGTRSYQNQFSVDGIATTSTLFGDILGPANPSMDFVQEVKVDSNSNAAEYQSPAAINVVTRSGANAVHGSVYEYYQTAGFNARDPFQEQKTRNLLHNFGGSLGGPILKNRTFFFMDTEIFNQRSTLNANTKVPTAQMRAGNFSALLPRVITNPFTGAPFPNNQIPADMLNQTALKIQNFFFPNPTVATVSPTVNNFVAALPTDQQKYTFDVRIDHQIRSNNAMYGRFDFGRLPNANRDSPLPVYGQRVQERNTRNFILSDTHTFSPTVINEARFGFTRAHNWYHDRLLASDVIQELGLTGFSGLQPNIYGTPIINISGFQRIAGIQANDNVEMIYQFQDTLTWQKGRHSVKFGGEFLNNHASRFFTAPTRLLGDIAFNGRYSGYSYADFLLGIPLSATRAAAGTERRYVENNQGSFFAQDSYRMTTRLTLNYGLRWDLDAPYREKYDRSANFDPFGRRMVIPSDAARPFLFKGFVDSGLVPIVTASQAGFPSALVNADRNNIAPRLGFAYLLTSDQKTVLRGGYGIYYERSTEAQWSSMRTGPYSGSESNPRNEIVNGQPTWQLPLIFPTVSSAQTGTNLAAINTNLRQPYVQQWNFTVERQLSPSTGLRVSYLGTRGTKLVWLRNLNQLPPSDIPYDPARRLFPNLNSVTYEDNGANSIYHGLNATLTRRWKNGLQFESSYTWAKNITDNDNDWQGGALATNTYDRSYDRGNVSWTRRHRMVNTVFWELPVGRGKRFLNRSGVVNAVLGGWQISAIHVSQTGSWFTPTVETDYDIGNTNTYSGRPDRLRDGNFPRDQRTINQWFDTSLGGPGAAWALPPSNRYGNAGSNILVNPGTFNINMGLFKNFTFAERVNLQLQATSTNVLNHPNYDICDLPGYGNSCGLLTGDTPGVISAVQGWEQAGPRTMRVGARVTW